MAVEHAGLTDADGVGARTGVWIGSALGGVAFGEEQHAGVRARAACAAWLADPGARGLRRGRREQRGHRSRAAAGRPSATRTPAPRARWPSARPSTPSATAPWTLALAGGAEAPLAPLTFGAFAMIRVLSPRNDDPSHRLPAVRPRPRRVRDGRGSRRCSCWRNSRPRRGRGATPILGEVARLRRRDDAYHMTAPLPDGARPRPRAIATALADAGLEPEAHRLCQRARIEHALNEPAEAKRHPHRRFGEHADGIARLGHEGAVRPCARCLAARSRRRSRPWRSSASSCRGPAT